MKKKTVKSLDLVTEVTDMYNGMEDNEIEDVQGLEAGQEDIMADEDADFLGGEIDEMDGLEELDEVGDIGVQEPLQQAADAIQATADAAGVEITAGGDMMDGDMMDDDMMDDDMMDDDMMDDDIMDDDMMDDDMMGGDEGGIPGQGLTNDEVNMEAYESIMGEILKEDNWDKPGKYSPARSHNGTNEQMPKSRQNKPQAAAGVNDAPTASGISAADKMNLGSAAVKSPAKSHNGTNETIAKKQTSNVDIPALDDDGVSVDVGVHNDVLGDESAVGKEPVNKGSKGTGANGGFINQKTVNLAASYKPSAKFNKRAEAIFESAMKKHFSRKK